MLYREYGTIERLEHFIDNHLNDSELSIDSLCKEVGISRSQLHRIIKEKSNLSVSLYVRKRRLEKAKSLLSSTELRISEIADAVGINNYTNFSKYFFEEFDVSPTDFRRKTQEPETLMEIPAEKPLPHFDEADLLENPPVAVVSTNPKRSFQNQYGFVMVGIIAILGGVFYFFSRSGKDVIASNSIDLPKTSENSIAVLPFKNLGSPQNTFFSDGIMEQIHSSLSLLENLKVISKTSSMLFRDTKKPIPQIANELHVKYVLEGSVLQIKEKIRITIELSDAAENRSVWTKSYDGNTKDVLTYMSQVAKVVAVELNQKLTSKLTQKIDQRPTNNLAAYNDYLQGQQLMKTRNKAKLEASILKFNQAIHLDPDFANAYSARASGYFLLADSKYIDISFGHRMAEKDALTAIRLDSENSLGYAILANIYRDQNKWEQANTTYRIALKYNPNDAMVNYWYSLMLRSLGKIDEAVQFSTKAAELDPLNHVIFSGHALNCIFGGKLELAEKNLKNGELLFNDSWVYYCVKSYYYIAKEDYMAALNALNKSIQLNPNVKIIRYMAVFCKGKIGQTQEVTAFLKSIPELPENYSAFIIAYAGLGNKELAMSYLQKMSDAGIIPTDLKVMPFYKILHHDKRYDAILQKYGLSDSDFSIR